MATDRILIIENPCSLSIDTGRIRVARNGFEDAFVIPSDVGAMVIHHHSVVLTASVLRELALAGACVLMADETHLPCAMQIPLSVHRFTTSRLRDQIAALTGDRAPALWREIVRARIATQAENLRRLQCKGALRLDRLQNEVTDDDSNNREAVASRHYWQHLLGDDFRRYKEGASDALNVRLNYGYAVLRSLVAREIAAAGLSPELGVGHNNKENPMNLADDLMEPYRFMVEKQAFFWKKSLKKTLHCAAGIGGENAMPRFVGAEKAACVAFVTESVRLGGQDVRVSAAVRETVGSYVRCLTVASAKLKVPTGWASDASPPAGDDGN